METSPVEAASGGDVTSSGKATLDFDDDTLRGEETLL